MLQEVKFYRIVCNDCNDSAGPPQETVEGALGDAVGEDFQNYGPGDGTGKTGVWRCPECALAYERKMGRYIVVFDKEAHLSDMSDEQLKQELQSATYNANLADDPRSHWEYAGALQREIDSRAACVAA